jgi:hypothetical protein
MVTDVLLVGAGPTGLMLATNSADAASRPSSSIAIAAPPNKRERWLFTRGPWRSIRSSALPPALSNWAASATAPTALLDSYEAERRPVAQALLATTDRAFRLVVSENWLAGIFRTRIIANIAAMAMTRAWVRKRAFRALSQTAIAYRQSPLSQTLDGVGADAPRAGDRFPWVHLRFRTDGPREDLFQRLDDTRFNLLVFGQAAPASERLGFGDQLEVHAIASDPDNVKELARVSINGPAFYLLRPDGHVALAGTRFDEAAVKNWFVTRSVHLSAANSQRRQSRSDNSDTDSAADS